MAEGDREMAQRPTEMVRLADSTAVPPPNPSAGNRKIAFAPDLMLVSAGFGAYSSEPTLLMTVEIEDFANLGTRNVAPMGTNRWEKGPVRD